MDIQTVFQVFGGISFILYGVHLSGVNLQKLLGYRLENILRKSTEHPVNGLLIGSVITGLIHSSGTTTIMVMGFISDGIITLSMAIPVILGSNIGSTVATQFASMRIGVYALAILVIGVFLHLSSNKKNVVKFGEAIIGFSLIFLGMETILSGMTTLSGSENFMKLSHLAISSPFSAIFIGTVATIILQSSTSISIFVVAMGIAGIIDLSPAIFLILGVNLGSSLKVIYLSMRGKNFSGVLAILHLFFNCFGILVALIFFDPFYHLVAATSDDIGRQIANSYTLYNLINAIILLPFVSLMAKTVKKVVPANKSIHKDELCYLDRKLICTPSVSIKRANQGIVEMAKISKEMLDCSAEIFFEGKNDNLKDIEQKESRIDDMTERISEYIIRISQQNLAHKEAMKIYSLMHAVADIEHLCDHILTVSEIFVEINDNDIVFSDKAHKEFKGIYGKLRIMQNLTIKALEEDNSKLAGEIINHENKVDEIIKKVNAEHLARIHSGNCSAQAGGYFAEVLYNLERVGDHYDNIAYAIVDRLRNEERDK